MACPFRGFSLSLSAKCAILLPDILLGTRYIYENSCKRFTHAASSTPTMCLPLPCCKFCARTSRSPAALWCRMILTASCTMWALVCSTTIRSRGSAAPMACPMRPSACCGGCSAPALWVSVRPGSLTRTSSSRWTSTITPASRTACAMPLAFLTRCGTPKRIRTPAFSRRWPWQSRSWKTRSPAPTP